MKHRVHYINVLTGYKGIRLHNQPLADQVLVDQTRLLIVDLQTSWVALFSLSFQQVQICSVEILIKNLPEDLGGLKKG